MALHQSADKASQEHANHNCYLDRPKEAVLGVNLTKSAKSGASRRVDISNNSPLSPETRRAGAASGFNTESVGGASCLHFKSVADYQKRINRLKSQAKGLEIKKCRKA